jgi:hypothetical protein
MQYMLMICDDESMILSLAEVSALPRIQAWDADVDARESGVPARGSGQAALPSPSASATANCWYRMARSPKPKSK